MKNIDPHCIASMIVGVSIIISAIIIGNAILEAGAFIGNQIASSIAAYIAAG